MFLASETGLPGRGWRQPPRPNSPWIEQVKTCPAWRSWRNGGEPAKGPVFLPKSLHHGMGLMSWVIWRQRAQGRGETYPRSHTMTVVENPRALSSTRAASCNECQLCAGCSGAPTCLCALCLMLCLLPALSSVSLSSGSLSLVFLDTAHITLLGNLPWALVSQDTTFTQCLFWEL